MPSAKRLSWTAFPEYLSDSPLPSREAAVSMASKVFTERETRSDEEPAAPVVHKADELETLCPGLHHDLSAPVRKSSSFYLTIGFMVRRIYIDAGCIRIFLRYAIGGT